MSAEVMRESLNLLCDKQIDVDQLATLYPSCACEAAASLDGGFGSVKPREVVRYFLTSPSDIGSPNVSKMKARPFKPNSLKRAYTSGLSVCRLAHATRNELEITAKLLFEIQTNRDNHYGGVLGVIDFPVEAVRICPAPTASYCVLETPLDILPSGGFSRPSHADIVSSVASMSEEDKKASREIIYNQIMLQGTKANSEDVVDCNLGQFLPEAVTIITQQG